jgi:hypothetical protein
VISPNLTVLEHTPLISLRFYAKYLVKIVFFAFLLHSFADLVETLCILKETVPQALRIQVFCMNHFQGHIKFFTIRGDIRKSRCTTGINDMVTNLKFATGINNTSVTGGKICHRYQQHQRYWWQNLPPVSLTPVSNLPPAVSVIPVMQLDLTCE